MEDDSFTNYSDTSLSSRFMQTSWQDGYNRRLFFIRLGLILITMIAVVANALTGYAIQDEEISCIWDGLFKLTDNINIYLADHDQVRNSLVIISSLLVDFLILVFAIRWVMLGTTWRPVIFLFVFYVFRGIVQNIFIIQYPEDYIWDYPGFPSLTVTYKHTSDFFFSGHVGVMTFCALENYSLKNYVLMGVSIFAVFFEGFVLLVTRAHYSIDLISGVIFAHYIWIVSGWMCPCVDIRMRPRNEKYLEID